MDNPSHVVPARLIGEKSWVDTYLPKLFFNWYDDFVNEVKVSQPLL